ncbi:MAG: hypothetical protein GMKNLPBB_01884 [Myxococcota bacterium]|nr:hypothetical protein [Myxococcota bacterium]
MTPEQLEQRSREFALASMMAAYPDAEAEATLREIRPALRGYPGVENAMRWVESQSSGFDELRGRYIHLFDSGKERVSLYGTEYGRMRSTAKGTELADIAGFYQAFGFDFDGVNNHDMLDHLAVELEFHALMLAKLAALQRAGDQEGCEIVEDAMSKFLAYHLGGYIRALAGQKTAAADDVYGPLLAWTAELVAAECERLGAVPKPLDYYADPEMNEEPKCASACASTAAASETAGAPCAG